MEMGRGGEAKTRTYSQDFEGLKSLLGISQIHLCDMSPLWPYTLLALQGFSGYQKDLSGGGGITQQHGVTEIRTTYEIRIMISDNYKKLCTRGSGIQDIKVITNDLAPRETQFLLTSTMVMETIGIGDDGIYVNYSD